MQSSSNDEDNLELQHIFLCYTNATMDLSPGLFGVNAFNTFNRVCIMQIDMPSN